MNRKLKWSLDALISLLLLAVAFYMLDFEKLKDSLQQVALWVFLVCLALDLVQFIVLGLRWYFIIKPIVPLPLRQHLVTFLYATMINTFSPANLAGDVFRFVSIGGKVEKKNTVIFALLRERLIGFFAFLFFYLFCWTVEFVIPPAPLQSPANLFNLSAGLVFLAVLAGLSFPLFSHRLLHISFLNSRAWFRRPLEALNEIFRLGTGTQFIMIWLLSFLAILVWGATVVVFSSHLCQNIPWAALGAVAMLVELIRLVPTSIQGIGVREGAFAYLFGLIGASPEAGFVLGALVYLTNSVAIVLCGFIGWGLKQTIGNHVYKTSPLPGDQRIIK